MSNSLERLWVSWLDSNRWRRFMKTGPIATLYHSGPIRRLDRGRRYVTTYVQTLREPALFDDVSVFCLFIGHTKSGGTLIGSLLDAHPNAIMADEADALDYYLRGFGRQQIFQILLRISRREAIKGRVTARRLTPYSFLVPGQWQGRYEILTVIGDSKAGITTQRLDGNRDLLRQLNQLMAGIKVRFIHVVRNPFDPISLMMIRGNRTIENAIDRYFTNCRILSELHQKLSKADLLVIRYEDMVSQPALNLVRICHFLGLEADDGYVQACTSILHQEPEQSRHQVTWAPEWIDVVHDQIGRYDFLSGYTFQN